MKCEICEHEAVNFGNGTYYLEDGKHFSIPFFYCRNCNSFIREVDEKSILSHLKSASHTNLKNEQKIYTERIRFFGYVYTVTNRYAGFISSWLDFGCSYGHFIDFLKGKGIKSEGIEISQDVMQYALNKGLSIYSSIENLSENKKYDVISLIDSLYYCDKPVELIRGLYHRVSHNGIIVLRITNRNWLAKLKKVLLKKEIGLALGDATISYSRKSISYLLENNGFKILKIISSEKGKSMALKIKIFYVLTSILNTLSRGVINLSPGLIVIARKNSTHNEPADEPCRRFPCLPAGRRRSADTKPINDKGKANIIQETPSLRLQARRGVANTAESLDPDTEMDTEKPT